MALHFVQQIFRSGFDGYGSGAAVHGNKLFNLLDEPRVDFGELADFLRGQAFFDRGQEPVNAVGAGRCQFFAEQRIGSLRRSAPGRVRLKRTNSLLQGFFEGAANGHHFADRFHLRAESAIGAGELFELPFRNFHHDIIYSRLETSRRFLGDVVGDFIEGHANGEAGSNFGDGEAGGFAGESGTARNAGIHFDDDHAAVFRVDGELDIRTAGFDADFAHDGRGGVAHALILFVGKGLRRSDGDGISGVDAHGIEILDGADDHEVVAKIAHDFKFVFFPAEDGLFDKGLVDRAHVQGMSDSFAKFFFVVGGRAAGSSQRERWADYQRKAQLVAETHGVLGIVDEGRRRHFEANFPAGILEPEAVFGDFDSAQRRANHFHFVFFEDAALGEFHGKIERGLAADCGKQSIGLFARDDFLQIFPGQRLDVGAMGHFGVSHDGGRVGVDENDVVAFAAQGFAGLRAGIVELAGLADDDRAGADDEDFLDVFTFGHNFFVGQAFLPVSCPPSGQRLDRHECLSHSLLLQTRKPKADPSALGCGRPQPKGRDDKLLTLRHKRAAHSLTTLSHGGSKRFRLGRGDSISWRKSLCSGRPASIQSP